MAPVVLPEKSVFNLRIDAMEPLLRTFSPVLICSNFRLQLRDQVFRGV
jgi:hypothetical protein